MRLVCSYCQKDMGTKPPLRDGSVSHGMCPPCGEHFGAQWNGMSYGTYLERFAFPVLMVEQNLRVVATNSSACSLTGRKAGEVAGLLGGEALECGRSRLPGGCGKTVHCSTCAIRNTVIATHTTGKAMNRVPAQLRRRDGVMDLLVSTQVDGPLVRVTIEGA